MVHPLPRSFGALVAILGLVSLPLSGAVAGARPTADYPSWDDVQAAKSSEATAQAEADRINGLLDGLEATASSLADAALKRGEEYLLSTYNRDAAQASADDLQRRADAAEVVAERAKEQVGAFVAQLYKSGGGGSTSLLLDNANADTLLYRLGTMSQLTSRTTGMRDAALVSANNAASLQQQADAALGERDKLAADAQAALQAAHMAQSAADAQVAEQKARSAVLYEQLAALKNSTAQVEQSYRDGVKAQEEERARQEAAAAADGDDPGSSWVPGSDTIASPAEAKAIAESMIGAYGWGGDQFSCLVQLWTGESGWRVNAYNPDSGAYGIPQSWPANKMSSVGPDWQTSAQTQITWGLNYIRSSYGTPCSAWGQWQARSPHWY